jgi:hypothetical protein
MTERARRNALHIATKRTHQCFGGASMATKRRITVDELEGLVRRLWARAQSRLLVGQSEQQSDLRLAANVLRALLERGLIKDSIEIETEDADRRR